MVLLNFFGRFHPKIATGHYAQVAKVHKLSNGQTEIVPAFSYDVEKVREFLSKDAEHKKTFSQQMIKDSLSSVDEVMLVRAPDPIKDQSYFLSNLNQEQLRRCLFPIGHLQKYEVRELADLFNLPTKARKDSQGICFLGKLKFDEFISHYLGENRGPIKCYRTGEVLGEHKGLWFHTIGQRKGIGLLLKPRTVHSGPWYVVAKDPSTNTIYLTNQLELVEQPRIRFQVEDVNWISGSPPKEISNPDGMVIDMKLRHGPTISTGKIRPSKSSTTGSDDKTLKYDIFLNKKDKGIAPGQFAAFYIGNRCLGAGVIANTDHAVVSDSTVNIDTVDVELSTERIVIDVEQNSNNTPTAVWEFIGDE